MAKPDRKRIRDILTQSPCNAHGEPYINVGETMPSYMPGHQRLRDLGNRLYVEALYQLLNAGQLPDPLPTLTVHPERTVGADGSPFVVHQRPGRPAIDLAVGEKDEERNQDNLRHAMRQLMPGFRFPKPKVDVVIDPRDVPVSDNRDAMPMDEAPGAGIPRWKIELQEHEAQMRSMSNSREDEDRARRLHHAAASSNGKAVDADPIPSAREKPAASSNGAAKRVADAPPKSSRPKAKETPVAEPEAEPQDLTPAARFIALARGMGPGKPREPKAPAASMVARVAEASPPKPQPPAPSKEKPHPATHSVLETAHSKNEVIMLVRQAVGSYLKGQSPVQELPLLSQAVASLCRVQGVSAETLAQASSAKKGSDWSEGTRQRFARCFEDELSGKTRPSKELINGLPDYAQSLGLDYHEVELLRHLPYSQARGEGRSIIMVFHPQHAAGMQHRQWPEFKAGEETGSAKPRRR